MKLHKFRSLLLVLTFLLVTACYHYSNPNLSNKISPTSECRLIQHELGETCVPLKPRRIIAVDQIALEALVALDLKPIGIPHPAFAGSKANLLKNKLIGVNYIGKEPQINLEKILQLKPDLIVGVYGIDSGNYKIFSQIAPTVKANYSYTNWQMHLRQIGSFTNNSGKAEELITQYEQRLKIIRAELGNKLDTLKVSVSRFHGGEQLPEFHSQFSFPGSIVKAAGISMPVKQSQLIKTPEDILIILSLERIDLLDADVLFVAVDPGATELFKKYQETPLWQTLNVVRNKKVYTVDSGSWILGSVLSANAILDDLTKYLLETY
ncbi:MULTISPECIES: iron-siderophore ABC transporter substrate-binding protein [unclassified Tolypothrix]|uniref:iron-siderophore ABC transporter substrate-binding protein n=1 Tax=unclassified Tolypothrix TaxID=2649714 RepID=UPI0005EAC300|nr:MULTISPECIES: iron-siderophore ABC transporter substrate-binding protein [unclassified Tolypothrix]BAY91158.1 iron(III) dicitrate ABC transporter permease protein FecC [Microchaete diplosiphon NIES-3275]EKE99912.1 periplasmic binding protein [Tolypothrix sp. PCC 7601]MBE9081401.1 iron-siderophore ABC transporter substrate-binding protein [Tolypothrix sp. LEGE 11397]UYD25246.1 iron-siderophore ABC transporter substrate-binding protein [Tolypothrix sp. PCC 7712]UYD32515.1 iron-siderophore ABC